MAGRDLRAQLQCVVATSSRRGPSTGEPRHEGAVQHLPPTLHSLGPSGDSPCTCNSSGTCPHQRAPWKLSSTSSASTLSSLQSAAASGQLAESQRFGSTAPRTTSCHGPSKVCEVAAEEMDAGDPHMTSLEPQQRTLPWNTPFLPLGVLNGAPEHLPGAPPFFGS